MKTFNLKKLKSSEQTQIYKEIEFLRKLHFCENIITLDSVYRTKEKMQLVMKFARFGSLRSCVSKSQPLTEAEIRHIME